MAQNVNLNVFWALIALVSSWMFVQRVMHAERSFGLAKIILTLSVAIQALYCIKRTIDGQCILLPLQCVESSSLSVYENSHLYELYLIDACILLPFLFLYGRERARILAQESDSADSEGTEEVAEGDSIAVHTKKTLANACAKTALAVCIFYGAYCLLLRTAAADAR